MEVSFQNKTVKEQYIDDCGCRLEFTFDSSSRCISSKKFDPNGNLIVEGIYKNGVFTGYKEYFTDDYGYRHEAEFDNFDRCLSDKRIISRNNPINGYAPQKDLERHA